MVRQRLKMEAATTPGSQGAVAPRTPAAASGAAASRTDVPLAAPPAEGMLGLIGSAMGKRRASLTSPPEPDASPDWS